MFLLFLYKYIDLTKLNNRFVIVAALTGTNLCGEAGGRGASDGLAGDVTSEHRVDRIEEAGLSSSNWSDEQDPKLRHRADCGRVDLNTLHHLCPLPDDTRADLKKYLTEKAANVTSRDTVFYICSCQTLNLT